MPVPGQGGDALAALHAARRQRMRELGGAGGDLGPAMAHQAAIRAGGDDLRAGMVAGRVFEDRGDEQGAILHQAQHHGRLPVGVPGTIGAGRGCGQAPGSPPAGARGHAQASLRQRGRLRRPAVTPMRRRRVPASARTRRMLRRSAEIRQRDRLAEEAFGQIRIGDQPGRPRQRRAQADAADQHDEAQAKDAVGAAAGTADPGLDPPQRMRRRDLRQRLQQALPEPGMGEPAEIAGDGVRLAEFGRQGVPGRGRGGDLEDAVQAGAQFPQRPPGAGAALDIGQQGEPLVIREALPGAAGGVAVGGIHAAAGPEEEARTYQEQRLNCNKKPCWDCQKSQRERRNSQQRVALVERLPGGHGGRGRARLLRLAAARPSRTVAAGLPPCLPTGCDGRRTAMSIDFAMAWRIARRICMTCWDGWTTSFPMPSTTCAITWTATASRMGSRSPRSTWSRTAPSPPATPT